MRLASLALFVAVGCAPDGNVSGIDAPDADRARGESAPATAVIQPLHADLRAAPPAVAVDQASAQDLEVGLQSSSSSAASPPPTRPLAVVFVIDQNADMAEHGYVLNEPTLVGLRALEQSRTTYFAGIIGHVDRRAHLLHPVTGIGVDERPQLITMAALSTTCSTGPDEPAWTEFGYQNITQNAPDCFADEQGRDPATALAYAAHVLAADAPPDAVKAVVMVGGRAPVDLVDSERRPDNWPDPMPTWKRTDRDVSAEIIEGHSAFVLDALESDDIRVLQVVLDEQPDERWLDVLGAETAAEGPLRQRLHGVQTFIEELEEAAAL